MGAVGKGQGSQNLVARVKTNNNSKEIDIRSCGKLEERLGLVQVPQVAVRARLHSTCWAGWDIWEGSSWMLRTLRLAGRSRPAFRLYHSPWALKHIIC